MAKIISDSEPFTDELKQVFVCRSVPLKNLGNLAGQIAFELKVKRALTDQSKYSREIERMSLINGGSSLGRVFRGFESGGRLYASMFPKNSKYDSDKELVVDVCGIPFGAEVHDEFNLAYLYAKIQ